MKPYLLAALLLALKPAALAQAPVPPPADCTLPERIAAMPALPHAGHYQAEARLRDGRTREITIKVLKGVADRRLHRSVITAIDQAMRDIRCPDAAALRFDARVGPEEGALALTGWDPAPAP